MSMHEYRSTWTLRRMQVVAARSLFDVQVKHIACYYDGSLHRVCILLASSSPPSTAAGKSRFFSSSSMALQSFVITACPQPHSIQHFNQGSRKLSIGIV